MRGPLAPAAVPIGASRAQRFDELVLEVVEHVNRHVGSQLAAVDFAVDDVPTLEDWSRDWVPLARTFPAQGSLPARIVVYRRPIETRANSPRDLAALVHDVVVEEIAELLGIDPDEVDPGYGSAESD